MTWQNKSQNVKYNKATNKPKLKRRTATSELKVVFGPASIGSAIQNVQASGLNSIVIFDTIHWQLRMIRY